MLLKISPHHLDTVVCQPTHQSLRHLADPTLVLCNRPVRTFLQHSLRQASFPLLSSGHLELSHIQLLRATRLELLHLVRKHLKGSVKEPNKFHVYETEKITRKASDVAEYIELFGSFTRDRHA